MEEQYVEFAYDRDSGKSFDEWFASMFGEVIVDIVRNGSNWEVSFDQDKSGFTLKITPKDVVLLGDFSEDYKEIPSGVAIIDHFYPHDAGDTDSREKIERYLVRRNIRNIIIGEQQTHRGVADLHWYLKGKEIYVMWWYVQDRKMVMYD